MTEPKKMTLNNNEQLKIEHIALFESIEKGVIRLSKKDLYRIICALVSPESREEHYLKKIRHVIAKQVYVFGNKCLSIKYAELFSKLAEKQKGEQDGS